MSELRPRSTSSRKAAGIARHGRLKRSRAWVGALQFLLVALVVVAVSAGSIAAIAAYQLKANIKVVDLPGQTQGPPPDIGAIAGGFNILIVGSDTGQGQGGLGEGRGSATLNDVTMLLHVSEDHSNAVAVSIPRDMVVPIPSCPKADGKGNYHSMTAQPINVTLSYGGLPCTVLTVEALTGLHVTFAGLITFRGVVEMSSAVGGVPVCLAEPIKDKYSGFNAPAGTSVLSGYQALAFLRSRHAVGDGSDLTRISSQQVFLSSLVRTLKSNETLSNFPKVYAIAAAASRNMTLSSNFTSLDTMVSVAQALKDIPLDRVTFVQYPGRTGVGGVYQGKVAPIAPIAKQLFDQIKSDQPFGLEKAGDGIGSKPDPNATPLPAEPAPTGTATPGASETPPAALPIIAGLKGQTAADQTCSVGR
jgi:LCP family protein required for cell wall assembly